MPNLADRQALFVSKRTGKRLTARRVEQIVARCLQSAGLNDMGFSPHKLRHTAATLMYQYGGADMLTLKEILGHANVSTTQIYTHINQTELRQAVEASPLSAWHTRRKKRIGHGGSARRNGTGGRCRHGNCRFTAGHRQTGPLTRPPARHRTHWQQWQKDSETPLFLL